LIDAGGGAGSIKIRDASDVLLAEIPLTDPCGTVNTTTGRLTITPSGRDESANADGTAAYGEVCDSSGLVHLALPAQEGDFAAPNKLVMSSLLVVIGGPVDVVSATVG
jgi:hypothetical protein